MPLLPLPSIGAHSPVGQHVPGEREVATVLEVGSILAWGICRAKAGIRQQRALGAAPSHTWAYH